MLRPTRAAANGIWTMDEVSENIIDTTWPTATDANFASVKILVHGDDQEGFAGSLPTAPQHWRNNASGSHSKPYSLGSTNGVELSTAITPKFGSTCMKVGNFGLGTSSVSTDFPTGTGDLTVEGWFNFTSLTAANIVDFRASSAGSSTGIPIIYCSSNLGSLRFFLNGVDKITGANGSLVVNTWTHIAWSRVSGNSYLYANGAQVGATFVDATNYAAVQAYWGSSANGTPMTGYMQELRITIGVGRYSGATLTVPTTKFADTA